MVLWTAVTIPHPDGLLPLTSAYHASSQLRLGLYPGIGTIMAASYLADSEVQAGSQPQGQAQWQPALLSHTST